MKKTLSIITLLIIGLLSCNTPRDIDNEIKMQITEFYSVLEAKNYSSISYSNLDTIENIRDIDGSLIRLTGSLIHKFSANNNNGEISQYTDTFDITIFEKNIYALPRGY